MGYIDYLLYNVMRDNSHGRKVVTKKHQHKQIQVNTPERKHPVFYLASLFRGTSCRVLIAIEKNIRLQKIFLDLVKL